VRIAGVLAVERFRFGSRCRNQRELGLVLGVGRLVGVGVGVVVVA